MARSSTTSSSEACPRAGLAAVALCALLEMVIGSTQLFLNGVETVVDIKRGHLDAGEPDDVVIFGDSRFFSIPAEAVNEALGGGLRVCNFSWPYMGVEADPLMLEGYLDHRPAPKLLIVGFGPEFIGLEEARIRIDTWQVNRERAFTVIPTRTLVRFLVEQRQWHMLYMLLEHRLMPPSVHHRKVILSRLRTWLWDWGRDPLDPADRRYIEGMRTQGWFLMATDEEASEEVAVHLETYLGRVDVHPNAHARAMAERFAQIAGERGIPVLVIEPPTPEAIHRLYEERGVLAERERLLRSWEARWPTFRVAPPYARHLPNEQFGEMAHTNAAGNEVWIDMVREACAWYVREVGPVGAR